MSSLNDTQCREGQTISFPNISAVFDTTGRGLGTLLMDSGKSGQDCIGLVVDLLLRYRLGIGENSN